MRREHVKFLSASLKDALSGTNTLSLTVGALQARELTRTAQNRSDALT